MGTQKFDDEYYVTKAAAGEYEAIDFLLNKYKGMVLSEAKKYYLQGAEFEDILQEGNIGLFNAIRNYSPEKNVSFSTFANLNIRSQIINAVKKASRKKYSILNNSVTIEDNPEAENNRETVNPEDVIIEGEEASRIRNELKDVLTEKEFNVLEQLVNGKTCSEIAELLSMDKKAVDNARTRIKKKLLMVIKP